MRAHPRRAHLPRHEAGVVIDMATRVDETVEIPDDRPGDWWLDEYPYEGVTIHVTVPDGHPTSGQSRDVTRWVPVLYVHGSNPVADGEIDVLEGEVNLRADKLAGGMGLTVYTYRPHEGGPGVTPREVIAYREDRDA